MRPIIWKIVNIISRKLGINPLYFVKNSFWMFIKETIQIIVSLGLAIAFTRLVSKELYGQYQFVLSVLAIVSIVSIPGITTALTRSVARGHDKSYISAVKKSLLYSLIGVPVLTIVGCYYYFYQNSTVGIAFIITAIFFPLSYGFNKWSSFLHGKERFDLSAKWGSIQNIVNTLVVIGIILLFRDNLIIILISYLLSYTVFKIFYSWRILKYLKNSSEDKECIPYGFYLTKSGVFVTIANNIDKVLIGIIGVQGLAVYSIATKTFRIISNFIKAIFSVTLPVFSRKKITNLRNIKIILFIVGLSLSFVIFFISDYVVTFLFSDKYADSIIMVKILSFIIPIWLINSLKANQVLGMKRKKFITRINVISPLVSIVAMMIVFLFVKENIAIYYLIVNFYVKQLLNLFFLNIDISRVKKPAT